ncbi:hypothetical protein SOCE26_058600 [Sorangium cellulosum]|uniref:Uncharacterized protein n=1 Tax=Sorangium cellulosum TaxID=56 RepID=A0A2L0EYN3_SORCE|nr:hypothetical protein [Sorangium cellulosum]AUX44396.1 hypothetical protein SOCE26_058600 [Sorangium cellulosum]
MKKHHVVLALALAGVVLEGFVSCTDGGTLNLYSCEDPCYGLQPFECDDPCAPCLGRCMDLQPLGFDDPILLWTGDTRDGTPVPQCPTEAPDVVFDGLGDFSGALVDYRCPSCGCTEASCELPQALAGSSSTGCDGEDRVVFAAPEGWDGACAAPAAAGPEELGSLLIEAPAVRACEPVVGAPEAPEEQPLPWAVQARGCSGWAGKHTCRDPRKLCVASPDPQPAGFSMCILYLRNDMPSCPREYPERRTFYQDFEDRRSCSPCTCKPIEGSACTALVSTYDDRACGELLGSETVTLAGPKCVAGPDLRLGSMSAEWLRDYPGACAPKGSEPTGEVKLLHASHFCCESSEMIPIP